MALDPCIPFWDNGDTLTCKANAAQVRGKRFVKTQGLQPLTAVEGAMPLVTEATAGAAVFGVSGFTAAADAPLTVIHAPTIIVPVVAGGAVAIGDAVVSDAQGRAVKGGSGVQGAGIALQAALAAGEEIAVDRSVRFANP